MPNHFLLGGSTTWTGYEFMQKAMTSPCESLISLLTGYDHTEPRRGLGKTQCQFPGVAARSGGSLGTRKTHYPKHQSPRSCLYASFRGPGNKIVWATFLTRSPRGIKREQHSLKDDRDVRASFIRGLTRHLSVPSTREHLAFQLTRSSVRIILWLFVVWFDESHGMSVFFKLGELISEWWLVFSM